MATAFDVAREWGGKLRPIQFPVPRPVLPAATISFLHYAGVPKSFRVVTREYVRFEFSTTPANLADVWKVAVPDFSFPVGWGRFWRIGEIVYTQARPWLCIEEVTGAVVAVDVEIDNPIYPVNSSVERMIRCMKIVHDWSQSTGGSLAFAKDLEDALSQHPELPEGEANLYWLPFVAEAVENECDPLRVECE